MTVRAEMTSPRMNEPLILLRDAKLRGDPGISIVHKKADANKRMGWEEDIRVNNPEYSSASPAIACRSDGKLFCVVEDLHDDYLDLYTSENGGYSWDYYFSLMGQENMTHPSIAIGEGNASRMLIAFAYGNGSGNDAIKIFWYDYNSQQNATVSIAANPYLGLFHPQICVDSPEYGYWYPYLVFTKKITAEQEIYQVFFSRSMDFGSSWSAPVVLADDISHLDQADLDFGGGALYITYSRLVNATPTNRDLFLKKSTDFGASWSVDTVLAGSIDDEFDPRVSASNAGSAVIVLHARQLSSDNSDIELFYSLDGADSWTWSYLPFTSDTELNPDVAAGYYSDRFHAVFWRNFDVMYSSASYEDPSSWTTAELVNGGHAALNSYRCAITANPTNTAEACVVWTDFQSELSMQVLFDAAYALGEYVMIGGDNTIKNSMQPLKDWKESLGYHVILTSCPEIYEQYPYADDAERIWNFLKDRSDHTRYALLMGDIDLIPMRFLYPNGLKGQGGAYGTDYYYSNLDIQHSLWDLDRDLRFGEFTQDSLDIYPEIIVGRVPMNNATQVHNYCVSVVNFEQSALAKNRVLFAQGFMDVRYPPSGTNTDTARVAEVVKQDLLAPAGWSDVTLYEQSGLDPSIYTCDYPLSFDTFNNFSIGWPGIVNSSAHGNPTGMAGHVWAHDFNNNGFCDYGIKGEMVYNTFCHRSGVPDNAPSGLVLLGGCSTGAVIGDDKNFATSNLASYYLVRVVRPDIMVRDYLTSGASAVIASTAGSEYDTGWNSPGDGGQQSFNYYFLKYLVSEKYNAGEAFYAAHIEYAYNHGLNRGIRVFNYFGDPSLGFDATSANRFKSPFLPRALNRPDFKFPPENSPLPFVEDPGGNQYSSHSITDYSANEWYNTANPDRAYAISDLIEIPGNILFASTIASNEAFENQGRVFQSLDAGNTWIPTSDLNGCWTVTCLCVTEENILFAGGLAQSGGQWYGTIYKSSDFGTTWIPNLMQPDCIMTDIILTPDQELWAVSSGYGQIFFSHDVGLSWSLAASLGESYAINQILQSSQGDFIITLENPTATCKIMRSPDGFNWFDVFGAWEIEAAYGLTECCGQLYAGVSQSGNGAIYQSDMEGSDWSEFCSFPGTQAILRLEPADLCSIYAGAGMSPDASAAFVYQIDPEGREVSMIGGAMDNAQSVFSILNSSDRLYAGTGLYGRVYALDQQTGTPTPQPTATPSESDGTLNGHVTLNRPGAPPPHDSWIVPLRITLCENGYPVISFEAMTDSEGYFSVEVNSGLFDILVKNEHTLATIRYEVQIIPGGSTDLMDFSLLAEGDANDDNMVISSDFFILKSTYNKALGDPGYDDRADFSEDQMVTSQDFFLLKNNYNQMGAACETGR